MAQVVISQKIKRTCDGCGKDFEYELIGERPDAEDRRVVCMVYSYPRGR